MFFLRSLPSVKVDTQFNSFRLHLSNFVMLQNSVKIITGSPKYVPKDMLIVTVAK